MKDYRSFKKRVFEIISKAENGDRVSQSFDWSIMGLIALSILSIILESFATLNEKYHSVFHSSSVSSYCRTFDTIGLTSGIIIRRLRVVYLLVIHAFA